MAALHSYLKAKHADISHLFTTDLICYGPALQEVHTQYIEALGARHHSRITSFTVRYKHKGWTPKYIKAEFENGREFIAPFDETDYGQAFRIACREACYGCKFRGSNHEADITLGDYWGLTPEMHGWNSEGVSALLVRSEKGQQLVRRIDPQEFTLFIADADFIIEHNSMYRESRKKPQGYEKFCVDLRGVGLHKAIMNYHGGELRYGMMRLKRTVKKLVPTVVKRAVKKIIRRQ